MEDLLIYKDLWDYLSLDAADIQDERQRRDDRKALALVRSRVTHQYLPYIQHATHAKQAWEALQGLHGTALGAKKSLLEDQLTELAKEKSEDIASYCGRAQKLRLQLVATGAACSPERLMRAVLRGLPEEFTNVREVLMYQPDLTVEKMLVHLQVAEDRKSVV